ncbi:FtsB family cell division protein [Nonomuraea soli]|uniref:Cell division protein FtsB n=1 Tax=Nonomuraea soli TaxID=1032476 RepID=A0A7W0CQQ6_9ACTN|nr:septum formation initiator family protein [Nonomuraea soli]MBA2895596.1 cell division protein FtsB [Nonomuraea soli]
MSDEARPGSNREREETTTPRVPRPTPGAKPGGPAGTTGKPAASGGGKTGAAGKAGASAAKPKVRRPQLTGRAAILAVVVCAIAMSLAYPVREYIAQRRQLTELQAEKDKVLAEQRKVEEQRRQVQDPNWTKRTARERLHYCDPGAKCYMVPKPKQSGGTTTATQDSATPPWYETLWESVVAADTGETSGS